MSHELAAVVWHVRGGYRARCCCRWTSARYAGPEGARRSWANHVTTRLVAYLRDPCRCPVCAVRIHELRQLLGSWPAS